MVGPATENALEPFFVFYSETFFLHQKFEAVFGGQVPSKGLIGYSG